MHSWLRAWLAEKTIWETDSGAYSINFPWENLLVGPKLSIFHLFSIVFTEKRNGVFADVLTTPTLFFWCSDFFSNINDFVKKKETNSDPHEKPTIPELSGHSNWLLVSSIVTNIFIITVQTSSWTTGTRKITTNINKRITMINKLMSHTYQFKSRLFANGSSFTTRLKNFHDLVLYTRPLHTW